MVALLQLRQKEPDLVRPFKVPFYPFTPIVALVIASVAFVAITWFNFELAVVYFGIVGGAFLIFRVSGRGKKMRQEELLIKIMKADEDAGMYDV